MGDRVKAPQRLVVGGGIGAGKSAVLGILKEAGYITLQADRVGHGLLKQGGAGFAKVAARWPDVLVDGSIDRGRLAAIVFSDPEALADLEAITHPLIIKGVHLADEAAGSTALAVEIPIPGLLNDDRWTRLAVMAPLETRIRRATGRGSSESDVRARIANQVSDAEWNEWADIVVHNTGGFDDLRAAVLSAIGESKR